MTENPIEPSHHEEVLTPGKRYYLHEGGPLVRIMKGKGELYAVYGEGESYRQSFLLEISDGFVVFPIADPLIKVDLFIYAWSEVTIACYPQNGGRPDASFYGGVEGLRAGMKQWFASLVELPWLKRMADRGDDMLMLWRMPQFLQEESDIEALWRTFSAHQDILSMFVGARFRTEEKNAEEKLQLRQKQNAHLIEGAIDNLKGDDSVIGAMVETESLDVHLDEVVYVVRAIAAHMKMRTDHIQLAREFTKKMDKLGILRRLIQKGGMQVRLVKLESDWYRADCGPMIGYYGDKKQLVALLPCTPREYRMVTRENPEGTLVTAEIAAQFEEDAFVCYAGFPSRKLRMRDVLRFIFQRSWRQDYQALLLTSLIAGAIPLLTPIAIETISSDIIATQDRQSLATMTQVILVAGFTMAAVSLVRSITVLRITSHVDMSVEAALWNRLLSLPTQFFRKFQAGELLQRMEGIMMIKNVINSEFVSGVFNFLCSFWSLGLMCYYSIKLTAVALAVWGVYFLLIMFIYRRVFYTQRNLVTAQNKVAGQVQEIFNGLAKFRVQGAESRAYYLWSKVFGEEWKWDLKLRWQQNYNTILGAVQPIALSMVVYYMVINGMQESVNGLTVKAITFAEFLGFQSAFTAFNTTLVGAIPLATSVFSALPQLENLRPVLEAEPETTDDKMDSEVLSGSMEVQHLSFSYSEGGPEILKDISFQIRAGETLAVVGQSGCGKSTLMRLLLGFEVPKSGAIYYDGQDLAELSVTSVRAQMGVVLQNGQLMTGDIFTNIVGTSALTMKDAWEAAKMVGIDEDIRQMPMGMHTMISEGSSNISGGQRQRLLIARAIANHPAILLLDEATSALDNRTQAIVTESLRKMRCTRILVAHRLTTIREADRILVLDAGRIVEQGTYDELAAKGGLFAALIERQIA